MSKKALSSRQIRGDAQVILLFFVFTQSRGFFNDHFESLMNVLRKFRPLRDFENVLEFDKTW